MKSGFLLRNNSEDSLGPLGDPRSQRVYGWGGVTPSTTKGGGWGSAVSSSSSSPSSWGATVGSTGAVGSSWSAGSSWGAGGTAENDGAGTGGAKETPATRDEDRVHIDCADGAEAATEMAVDEEADGAESDAAPRTGRLFYPSAEIWGVPKSVLIWWYSKYETNADPGLFEVECYRTWDNGKPRERRFTSVFTSPIDGERFASGRWGDGSNKKYSYDIEEEVAENGTKVKVVWYRKKVNAEHAAAAHAVDCLSFRRTGGREHFRLGLDAPYMTAADSPPLPSSAPAPPEGGDVSILPPREAPTTAFTNWFKQKYYNVQTVKLKDFYISWDDGDVHERKFTCVFVSPDDGERFASGRLGDGTDPKYEVDDAENVVWYFTKKNAEKAAVARAVDCINHRENKHGDEPNYCLEAPYQCPADAPPLPRSMPSVEPPPLPCLQKRPTTSVTDMDTEDDEKLRSSYRAARLAPGAQHNV